MGIAITFLVSEEDRSDTIGKLEGDNWFFERIKSVKEETGIKVNFAGFVDFSL